MWEPNATLACFGAMSLKLSMIERADERARAAQAPILPTAFSTII